MAERNDSHLLDGGDSVGMTDNQYKGMLLDQLEDWQEILDLAIAAGNTEIQKKAEKQIAKINEKLKSLPRGKGLWKHRLFSFYIFQECEYYDT